MAHAQKKRYTYADSLEFPDDGNRYEILEGELAVTPSPTPGHQSASGRLHLLLNDWIRRKARGRVYYAPLDVILADDTLVQPDLFWIAPDRIATVTPKGIVAAPDLVIEILSRSTALRDRNTKARIYFRHGVREYWLVDPVKKSVAMLVPVGESFAVHAQGGDHARLVSLLDPDLVVVPEQLFVED